MIWWFLISINFLFFLIKSFFTPKDTTYMNDINNNQDSASTEKYILGENYNLTSLKLKIDFGSLDTGTKIIEHSKGIINIRSIQQYDYDSYMLTPCNSDIWWIYSFSDIIHIEKIGLVSLEHYASNFKVIEILGTDVYPTKKWKKLGKIATNFTKSFELFNIYDYCKNYDEDNCWVKYMKFVVLSHHNLENNYYCTLTHLQIFASSGVDMLSDKIYSDDNITEIEKDFHDNYKHEKNEKIRDHEIIENLEVLLEDKERMQGGGTAAGPSDRIYGQRHVGNNHEEDALRSTESITIEQSPSGATLPTLSNFTPFEGSFLDPETIEQELIDTDLMGSKLMDTELIKKELMDTELIERELMNAELVERDSKSGNFNEPSLENLTEQIGNAFEEKRDHERNTIREVQVNTSQHKEEEKDKVKEKERVIVSSSLSTEQNVFRQRRYNQGTSSHSLVIMNKAVKKKYAVLQNFNKLRISKLLKKYPFVNYKNVIKKYMPYLAYLTRSKDELSYHHDSLKDAIQMDRFINPLDEAPLAKSTVGKYVPTSRRFLSPFYLLLRGTFPKLYSRVDISRPYTSYGVTTPHTFDKKTIPASPSGTSQKKSYNMNCYNYGAIKNVQNSILQNRRIYSLLTICKARLLCHHDMVCLKKHARDISKLLTFRRNLIKSTFRKYLIFISGKRLPPRRRKKYKILKKKKRRKIRKKSAMFRKLFLLKQFNKIGYVKKLHVSYSPIFHFPTCTVSRYLPRKEEDPLMNYIWEELQRQNRIKEQPQDGLIMIYLFNEVRKAQTTRNLGSLKWCFDFMKKWKNTFNSVLLMYFIRCIPLSSLRNRGSCVDIIMNGLILKKKNKWTLEKELQNLLFGHSDRSRTCKRHDRLGKTDLSYYAYREEGQEEEDDVYNEEVDVEEDAEDDTDNGAYYIDEEQPHSKNFLKNDQVNVERPLLNAESPPTFNTFTLYLHMLRCRNVHSRYHIMVLMRNPRDMKLMAKLMTDIWSNVSSRNMGGDLKKVERYIRGVILNHVANYTTNNLSSKKLPTVKYKLVYTISPWMGKATLMDLSYRVKNRRRLLRARQDILNVQEKKEENIQYQRKVQCEAITELFVNLITGRLSSWRTSLERENKGVKENEQSARTGGGSNGYLKEESKRTYQEKYIQRSQRGHLDEANMCLTLREMENMIYSDRYLKEYVDEAGIHKEMQKKDKMKNIINAKYERKNNDKSIKILNEIKETEESNSKLVNEVYDIISEYDDNNESKIYSVQLKSGKQIPLIINKPENKMKDKVIKSEAKKKYIKDNKLQYLDEFDHVLNDHIKYDHHEQNCIREEKIEEKAKNTRGHALLTLVDKVKTIENKNNYVISKLKDVIKITNNKTKIIYHMLSNFKILQNTISLLLKYIMINEKNMKNLHKNRNKSESFFKIFKDICILQINDKKQHFDSLQYICNYLQDLLYDEVEKIYLFEKSTGARGTAAAGVGTGPSGGRRTSVPNGGSTSSSINGKFPLCGEEEENILLHNKNSFHEKNSNFIFKEKKRNIFNFWYYENHCHNDIFKTPLIYYNSSVDSLQTFYFKIYNFFRKLTSFNYVVYKFRHYKRMLISYLTRGHHAGDSGAQFNSTQFGDAQFSGAQSNGTQSNGTQSNGTQSKGTQSNGTQLNGTAHTGEQFGGSQFVGAYGAPQNTGKLYAFLLGLFLIIFLINNFFCFLLYKHLSNKLNMFVQGCTCHRK
ncbi:hypothetical protein, conserved in Apicomplexan species [Plasmodium knowlesi strain H]|uniref:SUN domain-containing protein n=3 Tax=Plasmodium knowlesi TaxID=5850 RepID=A0A5K1TXA1_PLAKH|nr:uncharacterized protein PKNH_1243000 [Plasmodium knowlesi strain H]OTN65322.1 Uncharacterized protein PKNOH_S110113900 [Plasmodium knowlesi]CAA9989757.1 Sad1/UNC domain-containing protein, putative [Plasmodium knowlesi strain H]SBO22922.1 hypothetical protein, conserved in Apicomplexan species [Plasmodium knowlesi strain H]SBO22979.1 hypothetical protein, conserved in Apicomplexan species [Plasmodium knowlesi strain H]VVS79231.1 Sad1/UNC domain-containing protein, putative [Plasmodium knowl|eukprot:XP_002260480.1 [Plasmodium knowlesi strain H]